MKTKKTETNIYTFLETSGVLNGTDAQIREAKRDYWKKYRAQLRRIERQENTEYNVSLSRKNGDYGKIALGARQHKTTVTEFLRNATLAYLDRTFLVLNPDQVARIEQTLMNCVNEIATLVHQKEKFHWERERKFDAIAERITRLETEIRQALCFPSETKQ